MGQFNSEQVKAGFRHGWNALEGVPPTASFATLDNRASSANTIDVVLDFDASANESIVFPSKRSVESGYRGASLLVTLWCMMTSATSGAVVMQAAFRRIRAGDVVGRAYAAAVASSAVNVPNAAGTYFTITINLTNAQADSLAAGDQFALLVIRNAASASDTAAGDLELLAVEVREAG